MATVLNKPKPNAAKFDAKLNAEIDSAARRLKFTDYLLGGLLLAVIVLGYTLAVVVLDRLLDLPREIRIASFLLLLAALGVTAWRMIVRPALRQINPRYTARALDRTSTTQENAVINWVDLKDANIPEAIRTDVGRQAATDLATTDKSKLGESPRLKYLGIAAVVLVVGLASFAVFVKSAPFFSLLRRAYDPLNAGKIALRTEVTLEEPAGGDVTITAGEPLTIRVRLRGTEPDANGPDRVRLLIRYNPESADADVLPLERVGSSAEWALKLTPSAIQNGFSYQVVAGDGRTPEHTVVVRTRPLLRDFTVKYEYPAYTRLKPEETTDARLEGYRGTQVTLTARSNRSLRDAKILFDQQSVQPKGEIGGTGKDEVTFHFALEESGTYRIAFQSDTDEPTETTAPFPMRVITDQKPTIQITLPKDEEIALPSNGLFAVDALIGDDFGITGAKLRFRLNGSPAVPLMLVKYREGKDFKRADDGSHPLNLGVKMSVKLAEMKTARGEAFALTAGMLLEYRLEAADNCTTPGPNIGETPWRRIKIGEAAKEQPQDPNDPDKKPNPGERNRKDEENKHDEQQDRHQKNEKRDPQQPRPDQTGDKKPDEDKKPGEPNGEPKPGEGKPNETPDKKPGERDNTKPMPGNEGKPNEGKPNETPMPGKETKPNETPMPGKETKPGDDAKPGETKPQPNEAGQPPSAEDKQKERDLQKEADRVQNELKKADQQPGKPKPTGSDDKQPEAKPGEAKPKPGENGGEPGEQKPMPKDGTASPQPGAEKPEPKPAETPSSSKPSEANDNKTTKPMGEEKKPTGDQPQAKPGAEKPKDDDAGKPGEAKPQLGEAKPKPADGKDDPQPGEAKPQPGQPKAKPGETPEPQPKSGDQGNDKAEPKPGEAKPQTPPKTGEAKPKPGGAEPNQEPMGEAKPSDDKTAGKPSGEQKPMPGGNGKADDKSDPKEKPSPGASKDESKEPGKKLNPKELEQAAKDLNDADPKKKQAARAKLDAAMGKDNREKAEAEAKAKQLEKDLKSDDPAKKAAAEKEFKDLQEQMKKDQEARGDKKSESGDESGKPDSKPTPERIEAAKKTLDDLNSKDDAKRKAAEDQVDKAVGKDKREQLQQDLKDAQSGDPMKADAAKKRLEDQAKKNAEKGVQGDKPDPAQQPKPPTPEQIEAAKKTLDDLNSKDDAKRKAAEDQLDKAVGKEQREQLQQDLKDAQSGDLMKADAAKKRLEDQAKKNAEKGDKSKDAPRGPGDKPDTPGDRLKDDARNRLKTAELQLERFEKAKADKELQKNLGYTPEQYEEFLKGYRAMVEKQKDEVKAIEAKPNEGPRGPATIGIGEGAGKALDKRPDAGNGPAAGGVGTAPPGYTEAQRKFAEEAAKLKKPEPKK